MSIHATCKTVVARTTGKNPTVNNPYLPQKMESLLIPCAWKVGEVGNSYFKNDCIASTLERLFFEKEVGSSIP